MIQIPIEIGDVIRVGKFKNKRITVKDITWDEYGLPQVNGKGIMKIRIEKLMPPKEPKQEIAEQVGKQSIKFIGFRKNNDGKIVEYIESIVQDLGKEFKGPIIKFGYLNQFTGLRGSKEKGWFRVNKSTIRWEKSGVIWEEGSIQLDIKQDIQENNMKNITESIDVSLPAIEKLYNGSGLNDKEAITLQTTYKKEVEDGKYPTGFNLKDVKTIMPNLLKKNLISLDNLKFAGVIRLTKSGKDFVKKINGIQESFKPNKAKLDKMIAEALHSNDTQVKIKQKDKLWWICQEETDECLNAVGFETKEAAEHSALTKGYSFSGQEEMNEMEPEVLTTKKEKVKGVDKVEDMKLDKEKEIKLEILRIAKRVIKEELKKKVKLNELEITDDDLIKEAQEYARQYNEIERMEEELAKMKEKFKAVDEKFSTMMAVLEKELGSSKETFIRAKNILITIKRKGGDRTSYKYKEAVKWLYDRVNPQMKKLIDEMLEAHKTVTYIKSSLSVQYEANNWLSNLYSKVKNWFVSIVKKIRATNQEANSSLDKLESMI